MKFFEHFPSQTRTQVEQRNAPSNSPSYRMPMTYSVIHKKGRGMTSIGKPYFKEVSIGLHGRDNNFDVKFPKLFWGQ